MLYLSYTFISFVGRFRKAHPVSLVTVTHRAPSRQRLVDILICTLVFVGGLALSGSVTAPAHAAPSPVEPRSSGVVTADSLPTVQIDGIAWSQTLVDDVVYAGGAFAQSRPAGAAPGTNQTPRGNLLAYNIETGELISDFSPRLNAQVLTVAGSPDGSRVYVGGDFTEADGAPRSRIAAYSTSTGRLLNNFAPPVGYQVRSIVATNTTVYVGGAFAGVGTEARSNLAAFDASSGELLEWAPEADRPVSALTLTADGAHVIAGGSFEAINGTPARGLVKLDAATGSRVAWPVAVANGGPDAGITSLSTDGNVISGTAYHFGPGGNTEGPFRLDATTGDLLWLADCHGDTYGQYASAQALYVVGHSHDCGNVGGGFPEVRPQHFQRAMAFSKDATGSNLRETHGYYSWEGRPSPSIIQWLPEIAAGTVSGQSQGAWSVTGNDRYVALAGEFPRINGQGQQGLTRFATNPPAPGKRGPAFAGNSLVPELEAVGTGAVKIGWLAGYDQDDRDLTYEVVRSPGGVVASLDRASSWWHTPALSHVDTDLQAGVTYRYRVQVVDDSGNRVFGATREITTPNQFTRSAFRAQVLGDQPSLYWPLDDTSGSFQDRAGSNKGVPIGEVTTQTPGATPDGTAIRLGAATRPLVYARGTEYAPRQMSASVWIKTGAASGRILGFSDNRSGSSGHQDRQIYLSNEGRLSFGVFSQGPKTVTSDKAYNDNEWHQVVATLSGQTAELYVDGVRVGRRTDINDPDVFIGQWRLGWDRTYGWPNATHPPYTGDLDEVAIFPRALSPDQIRQQHDVGRGITGEPAGVDRLAGTNRFSTAADVATETGYPTGLDTVYIASGLDFPDALAGAALAGKNDAPILLVRPDRIPTATDRALSSLRPKRIVVLGGTGAVNSTVKEQLTTYSTANTADEVTRLAGTNRFSTAADVATETGYPTGLDTVYIASGLDFPDALAGAALAGKNDAPILLVRPDRIPTATDRALSSLRPKRIVVLGGTGAVNSTVKEQLTTYSTANTADEVTRLAGTNRFSTAADVATETGYPTGLDTVYIASGLDFPDALAGAALAGKNDAPILLVRPDRIPTATDRALSSLRPKRIVVLGGTGAVNSTVKNGLSRYID